MTRFMCVHVEVVRTSERAALLRFEEGGDPEWVPFSLMEENEADVRASIGTWTNLEIAEFKLRELGLA